MLRRLTALCMVISALVAVGSVQAAKLSHWTGWSCITHGAHFDNSGYHEGNGYNGQYSGPLGMTTPWLGHYPPGRDWAHSSVASVYAIADAEAAKHGYEWHWMQRQWPETFPPCAKYFQRE